MKNKYLIEAAQKIDRTQFKDRNHFTAIRADEKPVRFFEQDSAESYIAVKGTTISYHHNYIAANKDGEVVGVAWPQD